MAKADKQGKEFSLTDREIEVLALVAEGMTNWQIGRELGTSHRTVENQLSMINLKLETTNRVQAAIKAGTLINGHKHRTRPSKSGRSPNKREPKSGKRDRG